MVPECLKGADRPGGWFADMIHEVRHFTDRMIGGGNHVVDKGWVVAMFGRILDQ